MDINFQGVSCFENLKILRQGPSTMHIPGLASSAKATPQNIKKGMSAGFFRYLTEPNKTKEFLKTLDLALEFAVKATGQPG